MMSFSDLQFIFRFLPLFLALYALAAPSFRKWVLLFASLIYYALGDLVFFALLLFVILINHLAGMAVRRKKKTALALIIAMDVLLLVTAKVLGTYVSSAFLPVGISFYTFKLIAFQTDLYRGSISPAPSLPDTAVYVFLFPQLTMGPIMRYRDYASCTAFSLSALKSRAQHRRDLLEGIEEGAFYFCAGLALKVLIADHLAQSWQAIGTIGYAHLSTPLAWIGVLIYSLELYFDFWGYSLMAAGIGVAIGLPFIENFHHPYAAKSVGDFYRRWHMTLGSWFRDYVYIPLGGSRSGKAKTFRNLLIVWLLTSLWHGMTLPFLIWGMMLFVLIVWEKFVLARLPRLFALLGRLHVLLLVPLSWIPFATGRFDYLAGYFHRLFPFWNVSANVYAQDYVAILEQSWPYVAAGLILLIPAVFDTLKRHRGNPVVVLLLLLSFWMSVYSLSSAAGNPFLYFRF